MADHDDGAAKQAKLYAERAKRMVDRAMLVKAPKKDAPDVPEFVRNATRRVKTVSAHLHPNAGTTSPNVNTTPPQIGQTISIIYFYFLIISLPFFKMVPKSGFEMCFAIGTLQ